MDLLAGILEKLMGKVRFYIYLGKKPFAEVIFNDNEIVLDIKNPVLAVEAAVEEIIKKKHFGSKRLDILKTMGYKVKVRYKRLEFEL